MSKQCTTIEVLSPAGNRECLEAAILFGADAAYLAGKEFGMRAASDNFSERELKGAVRLAHKKQVRVYLACNTLPRNDEMARLPAFLEQAAAIGIDALIISDLGVLKLAKRYAPSIAVHISTQAGVVNYETANMFHEMGASRVVLARELSLAEISELRARTSKELEIEAFIHGAMCVSYSGRCLLSNYLTGRDSNRGDCAQPCRWKYALMEEKRPGEYFPVFENEQGVHIFNARDLCMIKHIPALIKAGVTSLKIEGRGKSAYYVASTTYAYRCAVDEYLRCKDAEGYSLSGWIQEEIDKTSHREYSTGFYLGKEPGQAIKSGGYIRGYDVVAVVENYENGMLTVSQRNRFFSSDTVEVLTPNRKPFSFVVSEMLDGENQPIHVAPHPGMIVKIPFEGSLVKGSMLRRKKHKEMPRF